MRKIILLAGLVAGGVAMSVTASANNWLLYLPAILAGSGGGTTQPPVTTESNNWLLFLPAILAGSQGQTPVVTGTSLNDTGIIATVGSTGEEDANYGRDKSFLNDPAAASGDVDGYAGFSFTKLAADGGELAYDAASWTCVRDNVTGLVWVDQAAWADGDKKSWDDAQTFASTYGSNCGLSADWRVPTPKELMTIVAYHDATNSVDINYFHLPALPIFWTASENVSNILNAWYIGFAGGYLSGTTDKDNPNFVRLVHGTALTAQLSDNGNESVTVSF
ncbi:DUF1566 domain-containing protein, partial [Desulfobulbus sp. US5]|nr:DUF1566 domain-containing protein [Desulfobulbus sp. US5]